MLHFPILRSPCAPIFEIVWVGELFTSIDLSGKNNKIFACCFGLDFHENKTCLKIALSCLLIFV